MERPKVRHVAVMTKNRDKMVEFYHKIFGLEPKRGFGGAIYMSDAHRKRGIESAQQVRFFYAISMSIQACSR